MRIVIFFAVVGVLANNKRLALRIANVVGEDANNGDQKR